MRKLVALLLAIAILSPVHAGAEGTSTSSTVKVALSPKKILIGGVPHIALPSAQMDRVELRLEVADKLEPLVEAQKTLIEAQKKSIETSSITISTVKKLASEQKNRGDEFKAQAEKEEKKIEELSSWYHSPLLWTGVGAVGVAVLGALLFGLHAGGSTINVQR